MSRAQIEFMSGSQAEAGIRGWTRQMEPLREWPRHICRWWMQEFLGLFPTAVSAWLAGRPTRCAVLTPGPETVACELRSVGRLPILAHTPCGTYTPDVLDAHLRAHKLTRSDVEVGLRLPVEQIFTRHLILPVEATGNLRAVMANDLGLNTPFQPESVFHDFVSWREGPHLRVTQWVVPRSIVLSRLSPLGESVDALSFLEAESSSTEDGHRPRLSISRVPLPRRSLPHHIAAALAVSACILLLITMSVRYARQQTRLDQLASELLTATAQGRKVRAAIDKFGDQQKILAKLRARKVTESSFLDVWEELSRILPLETWATEIRFSENADTGIGQVTISGFSTAAAKLVGLLDRSPFLADAALASAIAVDNAEQRERFSLRTTRKPPGIARGHD